MWLRVSLHMLFAVGRFVVIKLFCMDTDVARDFAVSLETVLAGHENWVYGVHWQPPVHKGTRWSQRSSCPLAILHLIFSLSFIFFTSVLLNVSVLFSPSGTLSILPIVSVSPCRRHAATAPQSAVCLHGQDHDTVGSRGGIRSVGGEGER